MRKVFVLSGAGISAESGVSTFRDAGGLWEGHHVMEVASIDGWRRNKTLVLDFYNKRRRQLNEVKPNNGHLALADLEHYFDVTIITQNVDDLHERAGSKNVLHLHGELLKARGEFSSSEIIIWKEDIDLGDKNQNGEQLRPAIVWFGEAVPMIDEAVFHIAQADIFIIVGTSLQVYPAAGLVGVANNANNIYYIDPKPYLSPELRTIQKLEIIPEKASIGLPNLLEKLKRSEQKV